MVDDLIDEGHARSQAERDNAWHWFNEALKFTLVPGDDSRIIIVNTRYHTDDLAGRVKKQYEDAGEDPKYDIMGYLVLDRVAVKLEAEAMLANKPPES